MVSVALVVEKEERLVRLLVDTRNVHRASDGSTKLIAMRIRAREPVQVIEVVVRVECSIAQIIVYVSVQTVASGLGHDVDHISSAPPVLRAEGILLDLEFLHVVWRWNIDDPAPALARIPRAV